MRTEHVHEQDSCLGVIRLSVSARLIAIIQLSYTLVCLILILTTNDDLYPMTYLNSLNEIEIFTYASGLIAACILGIGSLIEPRNPDYLLVWILLTSIQLMPFVARLVCFSLRMDLISLAFTMTSHGLQFILGLYFIHLMFALHRQLTHKVAYERLDSENKEKYSAI